MPLLNIPSADNLDRFARSLYFEALNRLILIKESFETSFEGGSRAHPIEWSEYIKSSHGDLDSINNFFAQAIEIGLKVRICRVSPFILLIGPVNNFNKSHSEIDFTDFRTIDAADLPSMVNTFCSEPISDSFISLFERLRRSRNKSIHLGLKPDFWTFEQTTENLVSIFESLWKSKRFLFEWSEAESVGRHAFFHDGRYSSSKSTVFSQLPDLIGMLSKGQFKRLMGREKSVRRYFCMHCLDDASVKWMDWTQEDGVKTAYLTHEGGRLECIMCGNVSPVFRGSCKNTDCRGNVIVPYDVADFGGTCHSCGDQGDDEQ